jgi:alkaline phosphatase
MRKSLSWQNYLATWFLILSFVCLPFSNALAESPGEWLAQGRAAVRKAQALAPNNRVAKNVIFMIGDGMNLPTVTAARIYEWQQQNPGVAGGEQHFLSFEKLPYVALSKTFCTNSTVTDSAAAITAMCTGVKTKDGVLGVNQNILPHKASSVPGAEAKTMFEWAKQKGLSTGVVTTTRVTHATPAGAFAHTPDRDWESDSKITDVATDPLNAQFPDIARQLIEWPYGNGMDVALGGGRAYFMPKTTPDPEYSTKFGNRNDGRDLTQEWTAAGWTYVWNKAQFDAVNPAATVKLLGLFEQSHMRYEADRRSNPVGEAGEPSLSEMTAKAIDILAKNRKGYMLMVEGGRIDHAHHDNSGYNVVNDTLEFAKAVEVALAKTNSRDTLIVVTADHGHVLALAGYPVRGNPILGKSVVNDYWGEPTDTLALGSDNLPYTTMVYGNGPGYAIDQATGKRADLTAVDTTAPTYRQQAAVPMATGDTHSAEDMSIYATGPGAHLFHGVQENTYFFHAIMEAMRLRYR